MRNVRNRGFKHCEITERSNVLVFCPLVILCDEWLQAPESLVLFLTCSFIFCSTTCMPFRVSCCTILSNAAGGLDPFSLCAPSLCMSDMENADLLPDLSLSLSVMFPLVRAPCGYHMRVFVPRIVRRPRVLTMFSVSSLSFVQSFGLSLLCLSCSCITSRVKKTFPLTTEISFKRGGPSAATKQKCPCLFLCPGSGAFGTCEGGGDVVGVVTPLVGGVAQAFHDDQVVELRVQLAVQEVEGKEEDRKGQVEVEEEKRLKEVRSWMTMECL